MKNLLFFILLVNYKYSFSQNVIPNYSFEDLKNNHVDKPTLQDHLQYQDEWENLNTHLSVVSELSSKYFKC